MTAIANRLIILFAVLMTFGCVSLVVYVMI